MTVREINEVIDTVKTGNGARLEFSDKTLSFINVDDDIVGRVDEDGDSWDMDEDEVRKMLYKSLESPLVSYKE